MISTHNLALSPEHRLIMHTTGLPGLTDMRPALGHVLIGAPTRSGMQDLIDATDLTPEAYEVALL